MKKARLMNRPEDYKKLGVKPNIVEPWEDGRRDDARAGAFEWWYFDTILEDGTKLVITFAPKPSEKSAQEGASPFVHIDMTFPDGASKVVRFDYEEKEATFSKEGCDIKIGPNCLKGNLKEYDMHIEALGGSGVDFHFTSTSTPWRPETGYFAFGDNDEQYFTWLCAMPRGIVEGTLTLDGAQRKVAGTAYHDHQWGNIIHYFSWNHWLWARQNMGDYNLLVFDLVANKNFGYQHYPVCLIEDKDGNIIFENTKNVKFEVIEEYLQPQTGKYYPKHVKYTFEHDGKHVEYSLKVKDEIDIKNIYEAGGETGKAMFDKFDLQPTYTRYEGAGELKINDSGTLIEREGNLIYEFVYCGKSYRNLKETNENGSE